MSAAMAAAEAAAQPPPALEQRCGREGITACASEPPAPELPATRRELLTLHGGLVLTNVIWSVMHVVMAVPLRRGANVAVVSVYREIIGAAALTGAAYVFERRATVPACLRAASFFASCLARL